MNQTTREAGLSASGTPIAAMTDPEQLIRRHDAALVLNGSLPAGAGLIFDPPGPIVARHDAALAALGLVTAADVPLDAAHVEHLAADHPLTRLVLAHDGAMRTAGLIA